MRALSDITAIVECEGSGRRSEGPRQGYRWEHRIAIGAKALDRRAEPGPGSFDGAGLWGAF